uniref:Uncharacterized protein n=1 Tax=Arundo donax TaxID=35708 RepID=A0A0A9C2Y6_ARUDO
MVVITTFKSKASVLNVLTVLLLCAITFLYLESI